MKAFPFSDPRTSKMEFWFINDLLFVNPSLVSKDQYLRRGDILVCTSNGSKQLVGKPGVFENDVPMSFGAFCKTIRLKNNSPISQSFLEMFFLSRNYRNQIFQESKGIGIQNLKDNALENLTFPVFPREDQDKMCLFGFKLLKEIRKDKKMLSLMDELVKSRFNEMFGELIKEPLCNVCDVQMGQSPDSSTYNDEGDGLPFYQGKVDFGDKFIGFNHYCSSPIRVAEASDILMSVRAPVGPVNMTDHECCIGRGLASIRAKKGKADTAFVFAALDLMKDDLARMGTGSTFKAINRKDIENLPLPSASLDKQVSFGMLSKKIDKLKFDIEKRLALEQELFDAKMHEFFD
jgi:type I restriction enzyme S subunit